LEINIIFNLQHKEYKVTEKVLHEVRFIETDDGFRIEMKGDKEKIRKMGFGPAMGMMGFGPGRHRKHHRGHGRHRHHHHHEGHGRRGWGYWWDDAAEAEKPDFEAKEKSPEDV
jgi:hypothetical protein